MCFRSETGCATRPISRYARGFAAMVATRTFFAVGFKGKGRLSPFCDAHRAALTRPRFIEHARLVAPLSLSPRTLSLWAILRLFRLKC